MEESKLNEKNAERNSKKKTIIIILLIIIIILLLLFFLIRRFGFICLKDPTGNVDIFDINFVFQDNDDNDKCCCCSCCDNGICTCNHENTSNGNNTSCCNDSENCNIANNTETNQTNTNTTTQNGNLIVYDNEQMYTKQTELNIFTHKSWNVLADKIAPETENSYQFIIRNNNDFNLKYSLTITEENPYNINMKFRLKMNGNYIVGNDSTWVTAEELVNNGITINANTYDTYTLDWKWFESDNDTEIGENIESNYKLYIDIYANSTN